MRYNYEHGDDLIRRNQLFYNCKPAMIQSRKMRSKTNVNLFDKVKAAYASFERNVQLAFAPVAFATA